MSIQIKSFEKHYSPGFLRKIAAELIATYIMVFITCGTSSLTQQGTISKLAASMSGGFIVTVMIYAVGHVSSAHMNPTVTLAFASLGHFPWNQVPFYGAAQITGSVYASFTLKVLLEPIKDVGTTSPSGSDVQALIMEMVVTFTMMFVTSAVATDTKAIGELAGIAVGSSVCITSILAGPVSGGSMNPARTLGPAIASGHYKSLWVYFVGPVVGTLLGAWSYNLIRVTDKAVQAISPRSFSLKVRRMRRNGEQATNNDPLDTL
ncbi:aquaporin NIP2-1-like [Euphorbia lathyris]|uniref:aquaporin NIP2-1-like n=1 Tax=Euphorbia lathyris TaxID=212925 RepID=UPI00331405E8